MTAFDFDILREVSLGLSLAGIATWSVLAIKTPQFRLYAVLPITFLFHVAVFYAALFIINNPDGSFFTAWSAAIRLQAVIYVLALSVLLLWTRR